MKHAADGVFLAILFLCVCACGSHGCENGPEECARVCSEQGGSMQSYTGETRACTCAPGGRP